jgi:TonB family protein
MKQYLRERERDAKTSTGAGVLLTVGIHLLILLCCAFTGMKYLYPPPPEETFLIDFEQEEEIEIRRELQGRQPQAEEIDLSKPVELVQRSESPHKSDKPAKTAQAKPDSHGDVETPAPKEDINKNALFPGMSKKDSTKTAPHSATDPSNEFKAGQVKGNTKVGKTEGTPNAHLKGRSVLGTLPRPTYAAQKDGVVVVSIWVDQYGTVKKAIQGAGGTTVTDKDLWNAARKAAMEAHFNVSGDAPALQEGTITYIFKLK